MLLSTKLRRELLGFAGALAFLIAVAFAIRLITSSLATLGIDWYWWLGFGMFLLPFAMWIGQKKEPSHRRQPVTRAEEVDLAAVQSLPAAGGVRARRLGRGVHRLPAHLPSMGAEVTTVNHRDLKRLEATDEDLLAAREMTDDGLRNAMPQFFERLGRKPEPESPPALDHELAAAIDRLAGLIAERWGE